MASVAVGMASAGGVTALLGAASPWVAPAYIAGSIVGEMLFSKKSSGSRIADGTITTSAYGNSIPINFGTVRNAGQLIWASPRRVTEKSQKLGKNTMGGGSTNDQYSYYKDFAILISRSEISEILKIMIGDDVIYDASDSNKGIKKTFSSDFVLYKGTEDQMPDSTIELHEGTGNVESYRGCSYIVFKNFDLTSYSSQIPNFTFITTRTKDEIEGYNMQTVTNQTAIPYNLFSVSFNKFNNCLYATNKSKTIVKYNLNTKNFDMIKTHTDNFTFSDWLSFVADNEKMTFNNDGDILRMINQNGRKMALFDKDSLELKRVYSGSDFPSLDGIPVSDAFKNNLIFSRRQSKHFTLSSNIYNSKTEYLQILEFDAMFNPKNRRNIIIQNNDTTLNSQYYTDKTISANQNLYAHDTAKDKVYYLNMRNKYVSTNNLNKYLSLSCLDLTSMTVDEDFDILLNNSEINIMTVNDLIIDSNNEFLYIIYYNAILNSSNSSGKTTVVKYNISERNIEWSVDFSSELSSSNISFSKLTSDKLILTSPSLLQTTSQTFLNVDLDDGSATIKQYTTTNALSYHSDNTYNLIYYFDDQDCFIGFGQTTKAANANVLYVERFKKGDYSVYDIVEELLERTSLTSDDYEIDENLKNQVCHGFTCSNVSTTRSYLEQLAQAYFFDIVETDWKLKIYSTVRDVVKNVLEEDLGCDTYSDNMTFKEDLTVTRTADSELSVYSEIDYIDIDYDYQQNTQDAYRQTVRSDQSTSSELPFAMYASEAKELAQKILFQQWIERDSYTFSTNYDYIEIEPGDVVTVTRNGKQYIMKINQKDEGAGILKFTAVSYSSEVYSQTTVDNINEKTETTIQSISLSDTSFLDIPILRNEDDNFGFYVASSPQDQVSNWSGSSLYQSKNNDSTFDIIQTFTEKAKVGKAISVLPSPIFSGEYDPFSYVDVLMSSGELSGVSDDQFYALESIAILGDEIIAFKNADLIDTNTYRISGLLREKWNTSSENHSVSDRFVLLNYKDLRRQSSNFSDTSVNFYKNATNGNNISYANLIAFKNSNVGLNAYPVCNVDYNISAIGDVNINWKKRTRGNNNLFDGFDTTDLDGDQYVIEIYKNSSSLVDTLTSSTTSLTITKSQLNAYLISYDFTVYIYKLNRLNQRSESYQLDIDL